MKVNSPSSCGAFLLDQFEHPACAAMLFQVSLYASGCHSYGGTSWPTSETSLGSANSLVSFAMILQVGQLLGRKRIIRLIGLEKCRSCLVRRHVFAPS
jgi:hypothetical protein